MCDISLRVVTFAFTTFVLAGCATTVDEPIPIGKNTYTITVSHPGLGSGLTSHAELRRQAMIKANQFCVGKGKEMQVDSVSGTGVAGWGAIDDTVNFMCVDHASPVQLRPAPNAVIEVH